MSVGSAPRKLRQKNQEINFSPIYTERPCLSLFLSFLSGVLGPFASRLNWLECFQPEAEAAEEHMLSTARRDFSNLAPVQVGTNNAFKKPVTAEEIMKLPNEQWEKAMYTTRPVRGTDAGKRDKQVVMWLGPMAMPSYGNHWEHTSTKGEGTRLYTTCPSRSAP